MPNPVAVAIVVTVGIVLTACYLFRSSRERPHTSSGWRHQDGNSQCSICLDDLSLYSHILPCGHRFHNYCIRKWLENGDGTCPNCRKSV